MRVLAVLAALAAAALVAPGAAAQSKIDLALAPGEVLLEVEAEGRSVVPARQAWLLVSLTGSGATAADARRSVEEQVARVRAAARAAGIAPIDIVPMRSGSRVGFISEPPADADAPFNVVSDETPSERRAQRAFEILVRDPSAAERIRQAVEESAPVNVSDPVYEAGDADAARRAARDDAFRRARADAEALAEAAGMRVVRVIRISERSGADALGTALIRAYAIGQLSRASESDVETIARLSVDFALARR